MQRGAIKALSGQRWVKLFDGMDLEVCLVPAGMPDMQTSRLIGLSSEVLDREVCTRAFVEFKGYTEDDGTPVQNSLKARLELYQTPVIRRSINNALEAANAEIVAGESVAVSD